MAKVNGKANESTVVFVSTTNIKVNATGDIVLNPKDKSGVMKDNKGKYKKAIAHDDGYKWVNADAKEVFVHKINYGEN